MILDFEIYQGKTENFPEDTKKEHLESERRAVLRLSKSCPPGPNIHFDRYYTSVTLLDKLIDEGISDRGTTMSNGLPNVGFLTDFNMNKMERVTIISKFREYEKITPIKWKASTAHTVEPSHSCERYS
ncbi:hypothetical protein JTB14_029689 [Gonioctena quinquepunctata]|nr:hypothetical protein JTB14_029689 [Gonioctena quinquepunctata]